MSENLNDATVESVVEEFMKDFEVNESMLDTSAYSGKASSGEHILEGSIEEKSFNLEY